VLFVAKVDVVIVQMGASFNIKIVFADEKCFQK